MNRNGFRRRTKKLFSRIPYVDNLSNYFTTSSAARAVKNDKLTYLTSEKMRRLENAAAKTLENNVLGDLAEFGVALGGSAIVLAQHARRYRRRFHGFDVFGMIPPPESDKDGTDSKTRYEIIAARKSEGIMGDEYYGYKDDLYGEVCRSFARHGIPVDGSNVQLHRGLFSDTLLALPLSAIAFAHLDCDWYDPVKLCLAEVAKRSSIGSAIVIDDYNDWSGCREATDEFIAGHPEFTVDYGQNVILRRSY